ncbi:LOW QUALITY PROTEIN: hypothetical protein OSB04_007633 [Centaurea solstitialis]|uniref:Reverse transcriptase domain-containing protein n=1 Tax=Centaurea solstitialis TaxID=347529 RepID=A0AA38TST0_9ASTR|nr:LOW QUALITY PROTEIN: hypothetical protein OSB04_007633 [Centaurea solstitialis]
MEVEKPLLHPKITGVTPCTIPLLIVAEGLHLMVEKVIETGLFKGVKVGKDEVKISHIQYADDVVFIIEWDASNLLYFIKILHCFLGVGLKLNISKTKIFRVGIDKEAGCGHGSLPFTYLGIQVGAFSTRASSWTLVIKIKKKLESWRAKMISFDGRRILVRLVLGSVPLYYFSLFHTPMNVIRELERVNWDKVLGSFGRGLKELNWGLLEKWSWRGGLMGVNIVKVGNDFDNMGIMFSKSFGKQVRDRRDTRFCENRWTTNLGRLKEWFGRLYRLEVNKGVIVVTRGAYLEDGWMWTLGTDPRGRQVGELEELKRQIADFIPKINKKDKALWRLYTHDEFLVKTIKVLSREEKSSGGTGCNSYHLVKFGSKENLHLYLANQSWEASNPRHLGQDLNRY